MTLAASRRLPATVCFDPVVVLSIIVRRFGVELGHAIIHFSELAEARLLMIFLTLVVIAPPEGLVLMVIPGGDRNLVSEFRCQGMESLPAWGRELDPSRLKPKRFGSIVAISGIQALRAFTDPSKGEGKGTDEARKTLAWIAGGPRRTRMRPRPPGRRFTSLQARAAPHGSTTAPPPTSAA